MFTCRRRRLGGAAAGVLCGCVGGVGLNGGSQPPRPNPYQRGDRAATLPAPYTNSANRKRCHGEAEPSVASVRGPKPPGTQPQNALWVVRGGAGPSLRFGGWPLAELPPTRGYALPPYRPGGGGSSPSHPAALARVPAPAATPWQRKSREGPPANRRPTCANTAGRERETWPLDGESRVRVEGRRNQKPETRGSPGTTPWKHESFAHHTCITLPSIPNYHPTP